MFEVAPDKSNATHIMFSRGGFQGARGGYGDSGDLGEAFFIENVFEELDADNEFFFDPATSKLYYFTSRNMAESSVTLEIPTVKTLFSVKGTQQAPVRDISLLGVNFRDTALSFLDAHAMPSGKTRTVSTLDCCLLSDTLGFSFSHGCSLRGTRLGLRSHRW
jgi:hypothetical protein